MCCRRSCRAKCAIRASATSRSPRSRRAGHVRRAHLVRAVRRQTHARRGRRRSEARRGFPARRSRARAAVAACAEARVRLRPADRARRQAHAPHRRRGEVRSPRRRPRTDSDRRMPNGIILLDKPTGLTSNGALQRVRKAYRRRERGSRGHARSHGDRHVAPMPRRGHQGHRGDRVRREVLRIHRPARRAHRHRRRGRADGRGGAGPVARRAAIEAALGGFAACSSRCRPCIRRSSATAARSTSSRAQGIEVERAARTIDIRGLELVAARPDALDLACECAKGTYIRVLGEDIAARARHLRPPDATAAAVGRALPRHAHGDARGGCSGAGAGRNQRGSSRRTRRYGHLPRPCHRCEQVVALRHGQRCSCEIADAGSRAPGAPLWPGAGFSGLAEAAARRPAAAAPPDPVQRFVNLCFTERFL